MGRSDLKISAVGIAVSPAHTAEAFGNFSKHPPPPLPVLHIFYCQDKSSDRASLKRPATPPFKPSPLHTHTHTQALPPTVSFHIAEKAIIPAIAYWTRDTHLIYGQPIYWPVTQEVLAQKWLLTWAMVTMV